MLQGNCMERGRNAKLIVVVGNTNSHKLVAVVILMS